MSDEPIHELDADTLALFAAKGTQGGQNIPQAGSANGLKVRRVMQATADLAGKPFGELRILDMACGEGVYAIEAALRGATVHAVDARTERMEQGAAAARRLGLKKLAFEQTDIRGMSEATHGRFDVIFVLGILYHLDAKDLFPTLTRLFDMCERMVVIDTHMALEKLEEIEFKGRVYGGRKHREHGDHDTQDERQARLLHSMDNTFSFWLTLESLVQALHDTGFSSVYVCHAPPEPQKRSDRLTLVALKGAPVSVSTYPWINGKTEAEIAAYIDTLPKPVRPTEAATFKNKLRQAFNALLRPLGFEFVRTTSKPKFVERTRLP